MWLYFLLTLPFHLLFMYVMHIYNKEHMETMELQRQTHKEDVLRLLQRLAVQTRRCETLERRCEALERKLAIVKQRKLARCSEAPGY